MLKSKETITVLHFDLFDHFKVGDILQTSFSVTESKNSVITKLDKINSKVVVRPATKFWLVWCKVKGLFV